ncbi:hypothetical protein EVAR_74433_1 [Eumeta japonica]|uniref:Uncharacterized protein n=1 Tax=Eumeta variegata TaxID=151549 RepID=A0A4C1YNB1_EUMVA|nr:hypothetical protein EVAR_74433_1 [Eumeta japonica]
MNSLVAYGSSSSSSSTDDDDLTERSSELVKPTLKLPTPALGEQQGLHHSVFSNPFVEAELAKAAILEKHVKMVHVDFL